MSLVSFHRVLIGIAILFCAGYSVWEFDAAASGGGAPAFAIGATFMVLAAGLGFYLKNLARFLGSDRRSTPR